MWTQTEAEQVRVGLLLRCDVGGVQTETGCVRALLMAARYSDWRHAGQVCLDSDDRWSAQPWLSASVSDHIRGWPSTDRKLFGESSPSKRRGPKLNCRNRKWRERMWMAAHCVQSLQLLQSSIFVPLQVISWWYHPTDWVFTAVPSVAVKLTARVEVTLNVSLSVFFFSR